MGRLNIPVGISDFEKIRKDGYYYMDKTELVRELLVPEPAEVTLITRPRRFGKTLGMSMLASFLDIRRDSRELFADLKISEATELCDRWMNQYPVLYLSFKDVDGISFDSAYGLLKFTIAQFCDSNAYLEESDRVTEVQKHIFQQLKMQTASMQDVQGALLIIMKMMQAYYNKPVVLLLDEYDVPLAKASSHGYYPQMLEVMKTMLSTSLKDNGALKFAVVTGCLKIAKESIFTGTNNFVSDTIADSCLNEFFGFTQEEVNKILRDAEAVEQRECVKEWYDGYHFGEYDVYCPWDVMNYVRDFQRKPGIAPTGYWKNTSDNAIIRSFIEYAGSNITMKMETLLSGKYIIQRIEENLTYDYLHSSEENLWSILYLTGYLTVEREENLEIALPKGMTALRIPNAEIKEIFETTVRSWFEESAQSWNRKELFEAVWDGDCEKLTMEMSSLLRKTISYHDYKEDFYHAFLAGIFAGAGYTVQSNKEHGEGRSDIVVLDPWNGRAAVFEAKLAKTPQILEENANKACRQIEEMGYAEDLAEDYDNVLCYGISFYKKRCLVCKNRV